MPRKPTKKQLSPKDENATIPPGFTLRHTLREHSREVFRIAWSPDGRVLASGSSDQTIRVWDGQTGQALRILEGHSGPVICLSFSWDGRLLASKSKDNTVRIWRTDHWEEVVSLKEPSSDS